MEIAVEVPASPPPSSNKILLLQILFRILFLGWVTLRAHRWVTFAERRGTCGGATKAFTIGYVASCSLLGIAQIKIQRNDRLLQVF